MTLRCQSFESSLDRLGAERVAHTTECTRPSEILWRFHVKRQVQQWYYPGKGFEKEACHAKVGSTYRQSLYLSPGFEHDLKLLEIILSIMNLLKEINSKLTQ